MKNYAQFGIFDFEDFAEELTDEQVLFINGGSCGSGYGGGSYTPSYTPTTTVTTTSVYAPCDLGYEPLDEDELINAYNDPKNVESRNMYNEKWHAWWDETHPGDAGLPMKKICKWLDKVHCDIIAWNLAIDHKVNPLKLVGKADTLDFNYADVDTIVNTYYKYNKKNVSQKGCKGQKGFLIFDWGGIGSTKDGKWDHMEYCEFSKDGSTYTTYQNNGYWYQTQPITYKTAEDTNGQGGKNTDAMFIPLA